MITYLVSAGYVSVETAVPGGRATIDLPRGARLPEDVLAEQVEQLLARGEIEPTLSATIPLVPSKPEPKRRGRPRKAT